MYAYLEVVRGGGQYFVHYIWRFHLPNGIEEHVRHSIEVLICMQWCATTKGIKALQYGKRHYLKSINLLLFLR